MIQSLATIQFGRAAVDGPHISEARVSLTRMSLRMGVTVALSMALAGCGATSTITQTAFQRQASDGASIFSAASETLRFVHAEPAKMTVEYGAGSMINYDDQVSSLPD